MANPRPTLWTPDADVCPYEPDKEHLLDPGVVARLADNSCRALPASYQETPGGPRIAIPGVYLFIGLRHVGVLSGLPANYLSLIEELAMTLPEAAGMDRLVMTLSFNLGDVEAGLRLAGHLHAWGDFRVGEAGLPSEYLGAVGVKRIANAGHRRRWWRRGITGGRKHGPS
jgi:hypothetical protein